MTSTSRSLLRTLYGIKFLKITIDNASQGFQEMIRYKTILCGYDFHKLIRDEDSLWGYYIHEFIRDKDIFWGLLQVDH